MVKSATGDSRHLPVTSAEEVRHFTGPVADHTVVEILNLEPTEEDLEVALVHAQGDGDTADIEVHGLSGKPARIYEILSMDEFFQFDER